MKTNIYRIIALLLALACLGSISPVSPVSPVMADQGEQKPVVALQPLMVIRFNQPQIDFEAPLRDVIKQARQVKSEVMFDLIQYIPDTTSRSRLATYKQHTDAVMRSFVANGVGPENIRFLISPTPDVTTDELYIFVR